MRLRFRLAATVRTGTCGGSMSSPDQHAYPLLLAPAERSPLGPPWRAQRASDAPAGPGRIGLSGASTHPGVRTARLLAQIVAPGAPASEMTHRSTK